MRMDSILRCILTVIFLGCLNASTLAESPAAPTPDANVLARFSVGRDGDVLVLPISLNGKSGLTFLISTSSPVTIVDQRHRDLLGRSVLPFDIQNSGMRMSGELVEGRAMRIGSLPESMPRGVAVVDLSQLRSETDYAVDGLLGLDLLKDSIIQIDFVEGQIEFLSQIPTNPGERADVSYSRNGVPLILCEIGESERPYVPLTTSYTGGLAVAGTLFQRLAATREAAPLWTGDLPPPTGHFNRLARLNELRVGSFSQHNVPVDVIGANAIGLGWLSQFLVTIDFPGKAIYLRSTKRFPNANVRELSGIAFKRDAGRIVVSVVDPDRPGGTAGLKVGDEVLRADGLDAPDLTLFRLYSLLRQPGNRVAFTIRRDGKALPALVTLPDHQFGESVEDSALPGTIK